MGCSASSVCWFGEEAQATSAASPGGQTGASSFREVSADAVCDHPDGASRVTFGPYFASSDAAPMDAVFKRAEGPSPRRRRAGLRQAAMASFRRGRAERRMMRLLEAVFHVDSGAFLGNRRLHRTPSPGHFVPPFVPRVHSTPHVLVFPRQPALSLSLRSLAAACAALRRLHCAGFSHLDVKACHLVHMAPRHAALVDWECAQFLPAARLRRGSQDAVQTKHMEVAVARRGTAQDDLALLARGSVVGQLGRWLRWQRSSLRRQDWLAGLSGQAWVSVDAALQVGSPEGLPPECAAPLHDLAAYDSHERAWAVTCAPFAHSFQHPHPWPARDAWAMGCILRDHHFPGEPVLSCLVRCLQAERWSDRCPLLLAEVTLQGMLCRSGEQDGAPT